MVLRAHADAARTAAFPRWGYLDKFEVNEYMARALLATLGLCTVVLAATSLLRGPGTGGLPGSMTGSASRIQVIVDLTKLMVQPPPPIAPNRAAVRLTNLGARSGRIRPAPIVEADAVEWAPPNEAGTDAPVDAPSGVEPGAEIEVQVQPRLPEIDEYVAVEKLPELVAMPDPVYPELAREAGVEGEVLVRVLVGADGFVKNAVVMRSVLGLDEAALAVAERAVFRPALQQAQPVAVWIMIPIVFQLHP